MRGLPSLVKQHLEKARDSALLAVEVYNKPAVQFKSGGYIVLMTIAWTALFHAIFFKRKAKPFYRKSKRRFEKIDGDYKHWELETCLKEYYRLDTQNPVKKNLEFFIPLRNKIEHRHLREIDPDIFGECQAMLLNFDDLTQREFGEKYCLRESLTFSLQLFPSSENLAKVAKHNSSSKSIIEFIKKYRESISPEVLQSGKYAFKAFLIQVANHQSQDALPIQFIHYDKLPEEQKEKLTPFIIGYKYKDAPVANADRFKPGEVVKKVQTGLGNPKVTRNGKQKDKFNVNVHALCWKRYGARPESNSKTPQVTNVKYCVWDNAHQDYVYTQEWVIFLIEELKDENKFNALFQKKTRQDETPS